MEEDETTTCANASWHEARCASLFDQILDLTDHHEFAVAAQRTGAEECTNNGFGCWDQFVAMSFCQLAQAESLIEIEDGLARCEA